jgi:hypothetical protein
MMSYNDEIESWIFKNLIDSHNAGDFEEHQYWLARLRQWKELRKVNENE